LVGDPDVGAADPELLAALQAGDDRRIRQALLEARLLVAVIALPGAEHASEGEMALALLESADGDQAVPAFTSLAALTAWRPEARPVPRPAQEVIAYARAESLAAVVLDPGTPYAWTLWRSQFDDQPLDGLTYLPPTWRPSRKARRLAAEQEVYALDSEQGEPVLGVVCPDGTLDADWARELLARCPSDTALVALPPAASATVQQVGRRL
jgi:hypothetical protein